MRLEDFFDFVSPDEIRVRGTRVGIEAILREYLDGSLPEEIALNYPPVTLEQVHAAMTYYLGNRQGMDEYLSRWTRSGDESLERQRQSRSPVLERLSRTRRPGMPA
jgi:uncharacterized protein (DUF433 family)